MAQGRNACGDLSRGRDKTIHAHSASSLHVATPAVARCVAPPGTALKGPLLRGGGDGEGPLGPGRRSREVEQQDVGVRFAGVGSRVSQRNLWSHPGEPSGSRFKDKDAEMWGKDAGVPTAHQRFRLGEALTPRSSRPPPPRARRSPTGSRMPSHSGSVGSGATSCQIEPALVAQGVDQAGGVAITQDHKERLLRAR